MKTLRLTVAAAVLSAAITACGGGGPTAPAREATRRSLDAVPGDSGQTTQPNTTTTPPPHPADPPPPPGDGKQIYGSGS
jgi:predicted small lipoprotein YifL